jgi:hypothetical protein
MLANFDDGTHRLAPKVIRLYSALIAVNLLVWVWAVATGPWDIPLISIIRS